MTIESLLLHVSDSIGTVSSEYVIPEETNWVITLAHGAGAGMNHPFMTSLARLLAEKNIASLRFNFPFAENKKGRPDVPAVAHKTIETAINEATKKFPGKPILASGKSFGGRMSSQYLAAHPDSIVKGIIFYGFPLHPQKQPSIERADHLRNIQLPMLFLQGTKDELATLDLIENVCSSLPTATLIKIEGADHGFKAGKRNMIEELSDLSHKWINDLMLSKKIEFS